MDSVAADTSSRRALAFSFLDRYAGLLLAVVSSMIVARLLSPAQIGTYSVAMLFLSFLSAMRDMGAGQYLVQEPDLTVERIRATWTVQLGLGLGFGVLILLAALPVSRFYAEPQIRSLLHVLALNFMISPFGSLTYAWLMREMRFDALAAMRFTGSLAGFCVSVGLAWRGHGAMSLAYGSVAATLANACVAIAYRPAFFPWVPGFSDLRRVLTFGGKVSATTVINSLSYSVPELVLGKVQGLLAVGLYSRANGLAAMFNRLVLDATQAVAMPMFAKAAREGSSSNPTFIKATSYVAAAGWAFFGILIVLAQPIVRTMYGVQWDDSVPLVRAIAVSFAIALPATFCSTVLMAGGEVNAVVRLTVITALQYAVLLGVGAALGLQPLGWALVLASIVGSSVWLLRSPVIREGAGRHLLAALARSLAVGAAATAASTAGWLWNADSALLHACAAVTGVAAGALAFVAAVFVLDHPLRDEFERIGSAVQAHRNRRLA